MNTVRPRPYPQRGTGNYNAGNEGTDKTVTTATPKTNNSNVRTNKLLLAVVRKIFNSKQAHRVKQYIHLLKMLTAELLTVRFIKFKPLLR